jgi:hypothetical protein
MKMKTKWELLDEVMQGDGYPNRDRVNLALLEVLIDIRNTLMGACGAIEEKHRYEALYGGGRPL